MAAATVPLTLFDPQFVGEAIQYSQTITGDTITAAAWTGALGTISVPAFTSTEATAIFTATTSGQGKITCTLTLASGQIRKSRGTIPISEV